ncbi:MAG: PD-(D/E)XK nuclease-like domain-containing protein [Bacteroidales bacterium]|nr:PD-(D/E)XK nuclease-like domain-containing protein [Bacteroidales bacterium]
MDQSEAMERFGFEAPDLSGAQVESQEMAQMPELQFDKSGYTDFQSFIFKVSQLPDKPATKKPAVKTLAVAKGSRVVNDKMEKYLAAPGESSSALKTALVSPRHYLIYKNEKLKPKDDSHFTLGTFIHSAFLEPSKFDKVKVLPENAPRNTNDGLIALIDYFWRLLGKEQKDLSEFKQGQLKAELAELEAEAAEQGYTFISAPDAEIIRIIRSSYRTYGGGIIPKLIRNGRTETSMYGIDPATGLKVKIRPDCMLLEEQIGVNIILSVKTTSASTLDGFMRDAAKYRYELAEGMYLQVASEITGRKFTGTLMLIAQTVIPFQCALIWLDAEDLEIGKYKYQQAMETVRQAKESDCYPGFECYAEEGARGIIQARFPSYIKAELKPQFIPEQYRQE